MPVGRSIASVAVCLVFLCILNYIFGEMTILRCAGRVAWTVLPFPALFFTPS